MSPPPFLLGAPFTPREFLSSLRWTGWWDADHFASGVAAGRPSGGPSGGRNAGVSRVGNPTPNPPPATAPTANGCRGWNVDATDTTGGSDFPGQWLDTDYQVSDFIGHDSFTCFIILTRLSITGGSPIFAGTNKSTAFELGIGGTQNFSSPIDPYEGAIVPWTGTPGSTQIITKADDGYGLVATEGVPLNLSHENYTTSLFLHEIRVTGSAGAMTSRVNNGTRVSAVNQTGGSTPTTPILAYTAGLSGNAAASLFHAYKDQPPADYSALGPFNGYCYSVMISDLAFDDATCDAIGAKLMAQYGISP